MQAFQKQGFKEYEMVVHSRHTRNFPVCDRSATHDRPVSSSFFDAIYRREWRT